MDRMLGETRIILDSQKFVILRAGWAFMVCIPKSPHVWRWYFTEHTKSLIVPHFMIALIN